MVAVLGIVERGLEVGEARSPGPAGCAGPPSTAISSAVRKSLALDGVTTQPAMVSMEDVTTREQGGVDPGAAVEQVVVRAPGQRVVAAIAEQLVLAGAAEEGIALGAAPGAVVAAPAVIADGNRDRQIVAAERFVLVRADNVRRRIRREDLDRPLDRDCW